MWILCRQSLRWADDWQNRNGWKWRRVYQSLPNQSGVTHYQTMKNPQMRTGNSRSWKAISKLIVFPWFFHIISYLFVLTKYSLSLMIDSVRGVARWQLIGLGTRVFGGRKKLDCPAVKRQAWAWKPQSQDAPYTVRSVNDLNLQVEKLTHKKRKLTQSSRQITYRAQCLPSVRSCFADNIKSISLQSVSNGYRVIVLMKINCQCVISKT